MNNTIPAPAVTTDIIDAQQVTWTTWTVGDHTLSRIEREDAGEPNWIVRNLTNQAPRLFENTTQDGEITYLIDWSSASDQTPEEALEFASALGAAAQTVLIFNQIRVSN